MTPEDVRHSEAFSYLFLEVNHAAALWYSGEKVALYQGLKLEGIQVDKLVPDKTWGYRRGFHLKGFEANPGDPLRFPELSRELSP